MVNVLDPHPNVLGAFRLVRLTRITLRFGSEWRCAALSYNATRSKILNDHQPMGGLRAATKRLGINLSITTTVSGLDVLDKFVYCGRPSAATARVIVVIVAQVGGYSSRLRLRVSAARNVSRSG